MPQFNGLNIPYPIQQNYIRWMVTAGGCNILNDIRYVEGGCYGRGCSNCIYSRYNYEQRGEYARTCFPELFFEEFYVGTVEIPERYGRWMLNSTSACIGTDCPCLTDNCSYCIFSSDNAEARKRFFRSKFPGTSFCTVCGGISAEMEKVNGYDVCSHCVGNYEVCTDCGKPFARGSGTVVHHASGETTLVCDDCVRNLALNRGYRGCHVCRELHVDAIVQDGYYVCHRCAEEYYRPCSVCGALVHNDEGDVCGTCRELKENCIHGYSFKPNPFFNKLDSEENPIYFGVELEVGNTCEECRDDAVDTLCTFDGFYKHFYLKSDSSIEEYGFELVTHPCTYKYHMEKFPWDDIMDVITEEGLKADSSCGIHIHISRNALTDYQWLLFDYFINRNANFWQSISGRDGNHYADYIGVRRRHLRDYYGVYHNHDRYQAVNFCNSNTVEVRTYASTTNADKLRWKIKHCCALVQFIKAGKYSATQIIQKGDAEILREFKEFVSSL